MKHLLLITTLIFSNFVMAQTQLGSGFNYQGALLDNGIPANGDYDIIVWAYPTATDGSVIAPVFSLVSHPVTDGLLNIDNIDFGFTSFASGNEIWLEILVKNSADPATSFETLTPRQLLSAVPYSVKSEYSDTTDFAFNAGTAGNLENFSINNANVNDLISFNGTEWVSITDKWQYQNNVLSTTNNSVVDKVVIGPSSSTNTARLTVSSPSIGIITQFEGTDRTYNEYRENGIAKGYVGSFQSGINAGTNDDDFEIGTSSTNSSGKMHITVQAIPQLTVTNNGQVGIGNTSPTGKFQVDSDALIVTTSDFVGVGTTIPNAKLSVNAAANVNKSFVVENDTVEKFTVHQNGGSSIGFGLTPPSDGLYVEGDIKQKFNTNGLMKYMVRANCAGPATSLTSFYNGTNNNGSVSVATTNTLGRCEVNFPTNINTRYWQVTSVSTDGISNANCHTLTSNSQLVCQRTVAGSIANGHIMILVY